MISWPSQEHWRNACTKLLSCGHWCGGVRGETECLPCLQHCARDVQLKQDADDMCMICFTEALSAAPSIQVNKGIDGILSFQQRSVQFSRAHVKNGLSYQL